MALKASKRRRPVPPLNALAGSAWLSSWWLAATAVSALLWLMTATAVASRIHFVMGYSVLASGPPQLEPFLASYGAWGFALLAMALWCGLAVALLYSARSTDESRAAIGRANAALLVAWLPLLLAGWLRVRGEELPPGYWEPLWLSAWSGLSFAWLVQSCVAKLSGAASKRPVPAHLPTTFSKSAAIVWRLREWIDRQWKCTRAGALAQRQWDLLAIIAAASAAAIGWAWQSHDYYSNFLLGFNDFGHFAQRVANTASGRGVLLESPVLPMFWDHFNPGLLLLVPLWMLFPSVYLFFVLQSISLASGAILVWGIARQLELGRLSALLFGLAWLAQPVLGQMNLAYTYGWHPISLAIPPLLGAIWSLSARRHWLALALAALAMSMEEGVIVIVCLFCAVCAAVGYWPLRSKSPRGQNIPQCRHGTSSHTAVPYGVPAGFWLVLAVICAVAFALVYRLSGIAEFQTARFATLGASTWEVVLSPLLRPAAFWGSLLSWHKLYFVLSLWLPCFVLGLLRGWRTLLATVLPLLVLLVWDHRPATSLAFQYASTLLPLFWLATLQGTQGYAVQLSRVVTGKTEAGVFDAERRATLVCRAMDSDQPGSDRVGSDRVGGFDAERRATLGARREAGAAGAGAGALATGLILSMFVGQMFYSSPTLLDVISITYSPTEAADQRRLGSEADGQWLTDQMRRIRQDGSAVLATGRIAAHAVGNSDVETVGQYLLRRPQLAALRDQLEHPIAHYRWIVLDRREGFQQTPSQVAAVEVEAMHAGFRVIADQFDIVVMQHAPHPPDE